MTRLRRNSGTVIALTAAISGIIVVLGIAMFILMSVIGGNFELQQAVDSGSLNLAKNAVVNPSISLLPGPQVDNFGGLLTSDSKINLLNYDRVIGQATLVAINAAAENTPQAQAHALTVENLAQLSDTSVGARLYQVLADPKNTSGFFDQTSALGSLRLINASNKLTQNTTDFELGFTEANGSSNVWLDPSILPNGSANVPLTAQKSASSGFPYLSGYTSLVASAPQLTAVTVQPAQPHLISQSTFAGSKVSPQPGHVPPNSFLNTATSKVSQNNGKIKAVAVGEVGSLGRDFPVSIPRGYVQITNEDPMPTLTATLPTGVSLFNNELMTGIYVDQKSDVFTTNEGQYTAWQKYNTTGVGPKPASDEIKNGSASKITDPAPQLCTWYNAFTCPTCTKNLGNFLAAYPYDDKGQTITFSGDHSLTAAEYYKVKFMERVESTAKNANSGAIGQYIEAVKNLIFKFPPELQDKQTGMKLYYPKGSQSTSYTEHFTAPPGYAKYNWDFGTIGTPDQLLRQVTYQHPGGVRPGNLTGDEEYNNLLNALIQRVREIKPTASVASIKKLFTSAPPLAPGHSLYIYMPDGQNLAVLPSPPPWAVPGDGQYPDGLLSGGRPPLEYTQRFPIIKNVVDAQGTNPPGFKGENGKDGDGGFHQVPYKYGPSNNLGKFDKNGKEIPGKPLLCGIHSSSWMPSSGFDNFLGKLNFTELVVAKDTSFNTPN